MKDLARVAISIDRRLIEKFDAFMDEKGYTNRSEAVRDLIRDALVGHEWEQGKEVVGTITLVYDHHTRELSDTLNELQHRYHHSIISNLHVHMDAHNCLEVLVLRGRSEDVKALADKLIGTRGVVHGKLTMATTGKDLA